MRLMHRGERRKHQQANPTYRSGHHNKVDDVQLGRLSQF
jgi:hypothetical protein